jgi:hypothetical protein
MMTNRNLNDGNLLTKLCNAIIVTSPRNTTGTDADGDQQQVFAIGGGGDCGERAGAVLPQQQQPQPQHYSTTSSIMTTSNNEAIAANVETDTKIVSTRKHFRFQTRTLFVFNGSFVFFKKKEMLWQAMMQA